jgi:hypothetical protein
MSPWEAPREVMITVLVPKLEFRNEEKFRNEKNSASI